MTKILHVVTNAAHFDDPSEATGLWLSELTHAWEIFAERGFEQQIISPAGGYVPLDDRSLSFPAKESTAEAWLNDPEKMALLGNTTAASEVDAAGYDAIWFAGGHGAMYDFPDNPDLQRLARDILEAGGIVSAVCHGYCGLLNVRLSDGSLLFDAREITGFTWAEEKLARVDKLVPYNVEEEAKQRGARYRKATLPFVSHAVRDGNLITGQNPASAKATAELVADALA
ncbi:MAG: type 1 glutamine amidotransferase domain-containing protein [Corynebacterium sp.]|uniref:type 1 glutamine amidotransferase domain-containing protein n=1 Tax=Corynebacterium sp. TaxID=1720 RepID=UPI0026E09A2B|nr:type 1 glutamine amidotransferase domain-containing protein [Corynebacterium sp.]MDO5668608.1 type 1 glutamine amidotransferase domain-containing protein [Corynebacterium sp.]